MRLLFFFCECVLFVCVVLACNYSLASFVCSYVLLVSLCMYVVVVRVLCVLLFVWFKLFRSLFVCLMLLVRVSCLSVCLLVVVCVCCVCFVVCCLCVVYMCWFDHGCCLSIR